MSTTPGTVIGGRYRIERRLSAGGVGVVFKAIDLQDGSVVALKKLLPRASAHQELVARFKREAELLERVSSHHVARVIDFITDDEHGLVLVMEFVDGEPLNQILKRGPLSVEQTIDVGWDVLGGVADLHRQQIVHRDLKPGNVILHTLPTGKNRAVIVDFGMSRVMVNEQDSEEISALTRTGTALGTLEYMAPEQMLNSRKVTGAADIYAVGAMLYRAVAGQHMFPDVNGPLLARTKLLTAAPPLVTGRSDPVAQRFEAIVMRMVRINPNERYQRADDVLAEFAELRAPVSSRSHSVPPSARYSSAPDSRYPSNPTTAPSSPTTAGSIQTTTFDPAQPPRVSVVLGILIAVMGLIAAGAIFSWKLGLITFGRMPAASEAAPANAQPPVASSAAPAISIAPLTPELDAGGPDARPSDARRRRRTRIR